VCLNVDGPCRDKKRRRTFFAITIHCLNDDPQYVSYVHSLV
jgi:hypothetical protein